jgi:hypothetical protein
MCQPDAAANAGSPSRGVSSVSGPAWLRSSLGTMSKPPESPRFLTMRLGGILALGLLAALIISIAMPNFVSRGPGKIHAIICNLQQLDGAVQMWAIDHHQTNAVLVTKEDIAPYLRVSTDHWVNQVAGERYVLKALPQSPEAVLTREVEGRPKGTVIRLSTNDWDSQFILPNKSD